MKILFICKKGEMYGFSRFCRRSSGLFNSTRFVVTALRNYGVCADIVEVNDNNDIDREVFKYKPDRVVIEALWVVPEKFKVLKRLHPHVTWWIHLHSHMPFLSLEGIAMDWIIESAKLGVHIIANSTDAFTSLGTIINKKKLTFLPNVYISNPMPPVRSHDDKCVNIACFGAVRPLKNHVIQALAAIKFAREMCMHLRFHVNGTRVEGGSNVMKNLVQLFEHQTDADLVLNDWYDPEDFLHMLHNEIDIGMQASLSETFNVVSADYVTAGLPIVVSEEVKWASWWSKVNPHNIEDIVHGLHRAYNNHLLVKWNQRLLTWNSESAQELWASWAGVC